MILKKSVQLIAIIVFLLHVFVFSFWLNLSSEKLSGWLEFQINKFANKNYQIKVIDAVPRVWGLSIGELLVTQQQNRTTLLNLQNIEVKIAPYTVILNKGGVQINAGLYLGKIETVITYYPESKIEYTFSGIQFNRNPYIRQFGFIRSNPIISGTGSTILSNRLKPEMTEFQLNVNRLLVTGNGSSYSLPLTLPDMDFKSISADFKYKDKLLNLDIRSIGDISAKIKGNIVSNFRKLGNSKIEIKIFADLSSKYKKQLGFVQTILKQYSGNSGKISIHLQGSIGAPIIKKI